MAYKKFSQNDIVINTMRAYPKSEFFIFDARVFYNNRPVKVGTKPLAMDGTDPAAGDVASNILGIGNTDGRDSGCVSLYEYNIDRDGTHTGIIFPYINKDTARLSFKTAGDSQAANEWSGADVGAILAGSYPLTASIVREYISDPLAKVVGTFCKKSSDEPDAPQEACALKHRHFYALKNKLNYNGVRSEHFKVSSSIRPHDNISLGCRGRLSPANTVGAYDCDGWNKEAQKLNLISIPSIFYGTQIKPGSVSLKWYYTGSLCGELRDVKRNGELIQVSGAYSSSQGGMLGGQHVGAVAGTVLYGAGFMILTGTWDLDDEELGLTDDGDTKTPQWIYWGAGANENGGVTKSNTDSTFYNASFSLSFEGTTETQVLTMFAHAKKGEANISNNPTYVQYDQPLLRTTSSFSYEENPERYVFNTVSSSFIGHSASFERQVYVSKVAIYDENKNLIGVASLANPILKKEDRDITFKIKLDM